MRNQRRPLSKGTDTRSLDLITKSLALAPWRSGTRSASLDASLRYDSAMQVHDPILIVRLQCNFANGIVTLGYKMDPLIPLALGPIDNHSAARRLRAIDQTIQPPDYAFKEPTRLCRTVLSRR